MDFRITLDLSNFFTDYRRRVKIFVDDRIKTVRDIENKLTTLFEIDKFYLTSDNDYLPSSEDVRILQSNEVLCAIPITVDGESVVIKNYGKKSKKQKTKQEGKVLSQENEVKVDDFCAYSVEKDDSEKKSKDKRSNLLTSNEGNYSIDDKHEHKNKIVHVVHDNSSEKSVVKNNCTELHEFRCKGDLSSYVKKCAIPTITHEYLNVKKINIVKIDVVKDSPQKTFENENQSMVPKCSISMSNICGNDINNTHLPNTVIDERFDIKQKLNAGDKQDVNHNSDLRNRMKIDNKDIKSSYSKQKYFFFTSTIQTPVPKLNEEKNCDIVSPKKDNQSYSLKYFKRKSCSISPSVTPGVPNEEMNSEVPNEEMNYEKSASTPTKNDMPFKKLNTNKIEEINKEDSCDFSGLLSTSESGSIHKSISAMSGLEDLPSNLSTSFPRPKEISGIGHLLEELKLQHSSPYNTTAESDCSQFITKRKRKRVRKRKKHIPEVNISTETIPFTAVDYSQIKMNSKGCPSLHIKYEYDNDDESNMKIIKINEDKQVKEENVEIINITSDQESFVVKEDNIPKAPLMKNILPKIGDIIAFKVLRITENYTPEISHFVTGKVVKLENNAIVFDIIVGLDQIQQPSGKFSIENDSSNSHKKAKNNYISFNWNDLIDPRLLN